MKTGRKGEDPKKPKTNGDNPKTNQEVKVTANKPVEPPQKQYTWDDVSKNEEVKSRNKSAREKYQSEVETYNKQIKAYNELEPKGVKKDLNTFFTGGGRYLNPTELEAWNKEQKESGTDRSLLRANKVYVNKEYGKEGSVSALKTTTGKSYSGGLGAFHEWLEKPEQSKAPIYEKEEDIDFRKLPLPEKLPLLKPSKIKSSDLKLIRSTQTAPAEKADWEAPDGSTKYRTKYILPDISTTNKGKSLGRFIKAKAEAIGKDNALTPGLIKTQGKERLIQGKTGREAKMAKAYFSGYEGQSKFDIKGTSEERGAIDRLKTDKADFSKGIKEARKAGDKEKVEGYRASRKDVKSEIKQAKLASKYLTKLGQETTGVREGQELRSTGKIKANTPAAYLGFTGSKQDTYNSDANFNKFLAKSSTDNPANRNTIPKQMETVEPKMTRSQRKESRAIQEKVMKNMKN